MAKLDRVNEEFERLTNEGIIKPVTQPTDWLSNILVKEKPNRKLRICIDPSQTINRAIRRPKYTIPTIEEKLPLVTNAKVFTIVDVSEAFYTIELDEESSLLTTFQGPSGRYCYTRMPFGIAESAVKIAKNILKKSPKEDPYLALLAYRNTPRQGYNYSPAQGLMSRRLKDIIPTAHHQLTPQRASPSLVHGGIAERRWKWMAQYNKKVSQPLREFSKRGKVFVKPRPGNNHQPWIYGEVIGSTAPRSCTVNTSAGPV